MWIRRKWPIISFLKVPAGWRRGKPWNGSFRNSKNGRLQSSGSVPGEYLSFQWEGAENDLLLVEMTFLEMPDNSTLLRITEGTMENNEMGVKWVAQNTEGWANFLASLKAYLEYDINLRKDAFDFLKQKQR